MDEVSIRALHWAFESYALRRALVIAAAVFVLSLVWMQDVYDARYSIHGSFFWSRLVNWTPLIGLLLVSIFFPDPSAPTMITHHIMAVVCLHQAFFSTVMIFSSELSLACLNNESCRVMNRFTQAAIVTAMYARAVCIVVGFRNHWKAHRLMFSFLGTCQLMRTVTQRWLLGPAHLSGYHPGDRHFEDALELGCSLLLSGLLLTPAVRLRCSAALWMGNVHLCMEDLGSTILRVEVAMMRLEGWRARAVRASPDLFVGSVAFLLFGLPALRLYSAWLFVLISISTFLLALSVGPVDGFAPLPLTRMFWLCCTIPAGEVLLLMRQPAMTGRDRTCAMAIVGTHASNLLFMIAAVVAMECRWLTAWAGIRGYQAIIGINVLVSALFICSIGGTTVPATSGASTFGEAALCSALSLLLAAGTPSAVRRVMLDKWTSVVGMSPTRAAPESSVLHLFHCYLGSVVSVMEKLPGGVQSMETSSTASEASEDSCSGATSSMCTESLGSTYLAEEDRVNLPLNSLHAHLELQSIPR